MVQQGRIPEPVTSSASREHPEGGSSCDREVLEEIWIKPEDTDLQWKMHQMNYGKEPREERKLKTYSETH